MEINSMSHLLSKSDFKIARTCPTKLYYKKLRYPSTKDDDQYLELLAEGGFFVEKVAKLLFPEGQEVPFDQDHNEAARHTLSKEVDYQMDSVTRHAETFSASLTPTLRRIETPINVSCKDCEYRMLEPHTPNGFDECWREMAKTAPHLLDLYHVGEIGGRGTPLANALIKQGKAGLFDIPIELVVNSEGKIGENNKRQLVQIEGTRFGPEWIHPELADILRTFAYHMIRFKIVPCLGFDMAFEDFSR
jgi:hypothetical protein